MKQTIIILQLLLTFSLCKAQNAEVSIQYDTEKKTEYKIGEIITLSVDVIMPSKICIDGIENSKIFLSGLQIIDEKEWFNLEDNLWRKDLTVKIVDNKKGYSKLTIFRKADKGGFFIQEKYLVE